MSDLTEWIRDLVLCVRSEVEKLQPNQQSRITNIDNLAKPCQVDFIWLQNSRLGLQLQFIIFQHFIDRKDLEITIHGPFDMNKAIDVFEQILADNKWDKKLEGEPRYFIEEDDDRTIRKILESVFINLSQRIKMFVEGEASKGPTDLAGDARLTEKGVITEDCFYWMIRGDILTKIPEEIGKDVISHFIGKSALGKQQAEVKSALQPKKDKLLAYGTFFYPAIWVGEMPKRTFREKVIHPQFVNPAKTIYDFKYKGIKTIVREDGLFALLIDNKEHVLELLNEIMGVALLSGLRSLAVRESEIADLSLEPDTFAISSLNMSLVSDRMRLDLDPIGASPMAMPTPRNIISKEDIESLLARAEAITADDNAKRSLLFLLESFTHFVSYEYPQCFVMGWTVVEKFIISVWEDFLDNKEIRGKRRDKFSWRRRTIDAIIETLNLAGILKDADYKQLMELKEKRNDILHAEGTVSGQEAKDCLDTAFSFYKLSIQKIDKSCEIHPQFRLLGLR